METQAGKSLHPLLWVAGVVFILFCGAGVAAMMGWIGSGKAEPAPLSNLDKARAPERAHPAPKAQHAAICLDWARLRKPRRSNQSRSRPGSVTAPTPKWWKD